MTSRSIILGILLALVLFGMPIGALQTAGYDVTVSPNTDIEATNVDFEGTTYEVSTIGNVPVGTEFTASTAAPDDETYDLYMYNSDEQIVDTASNLQGDDTATFDTSGFDPGTYVVAIRGSDGSFHDITPVVVDGYQLDSEIPTTVTAEESFNVTVAVDQIVPSKTEIQQVDVVFVRGDTSQQYELTNTGESVYERTISLDAVDEYSVYVVVRGPNTVDGEYEVTGISTTTSLTVESAETPTPTVTTTSGGGGGDETTQTTTSTSSSDSTPAETATPTTQPTTADTTSTSTTTSTSPTKTPTADATVTSSPTSDSVITPGPTPTPSTQTTETTGSLPVWVIVTAILVAGLLFNRRE